MAQKKYVETVWRNSVKCQKKVAVNLLDEVRLKASKP